MDFAILLRRIDGPAFRPDRQGLRIDFSGGQHLEEILSIECAGHAFCLGAALQRLLLAEQADDQVRTAQRLAEPLRSCWRAASSWKLTSSTQC